MNIFEAMTDDDLDQTLGMYQAALARRETETRGWKRLAFDLIRAAGGVQRVSFMTAFSAHTKDTLEAYYDYANAEMVYRVYRDTSNEQYTGERSSE
jgi:hypothetical protein